MNKSDDSRQASFDTTFARVAVLGYGPAARDHALGLRGAGRDVRVGLRLGGMSWVRAKDDGFSARPASVAVEAADAVVVLVPDDEQASVYWHAIEPHAEPDALLVFDRALALEIGAFEPEGRDVVIVTCEPGDGKRSCRVAVHRDATGRALERAIAYAHAAFGAATSIATTTLAAEVDAELADMEARAGGLGALLAHVDDKAARVRDTHAPEEARLAFYERLRDVLERRVAASGPRAVVDRSSGTSLVAAGQGPRRGVA